MFAAAPSPIWFSQKGPEGKQRRGPTTENGSGVSRWAVAAFPAMTKVSPNGGRGVANYGANFKRYGFDL